MSKPGSVSEEPTTNLCGGCSVEVLSGEKGMQCDWCNKWNHILCCSMPEDLYKVLVKHEKKSIGIKWFCKICETYFGKIKMKIKILSERQGVVEVKQFDSDKTLNEVKNEVLELKKNFADFVKERELKADSISVKVDDKIDGMQLELSEIKKSYSDMVQVNSAAGGSLLVNPTNAPSSIIKLEVSEVMEREKRKNNLVIFGIDETNDEAVTREKVNVIIRAVGLDESKIKYFGRVGRHVAGARPRIVRVVCEDSEVKRNLLKATNRLKTLEGYSNIYIDLDLTKVQQIEDKKLREKLKEIRVTDKDAKINNGEIVIFESGSRKVLFSERK